MASAGNRHSRRVQWLKIALPLAALAILSTLFLVAETLDPEAAIPFAEVDVERILRDQGVTRPSFGGLTEGGARVSLSAEAVRPDADAQSRFNGEILESLIELPTGTRIDIAAPLGIIDAGESLAQLSGGAELVSSLGYRITTDTLSTHWDVLRAEAPEAVRAIGPAGELDAGAMLLSRAPGEAGYTMVFNKGVRLVYQPPE